MLAGILSSMVSEAQIFEKFIDVYFKSYYRTTAAEYIAEQRILLEKTKVNAAEKVKINQVHIEKEK